ncbi:MAG: hypothetical protein IPM52_14490 [Bacteroidetes bacterium]|nr:hypothetical protein [Bacteroidota bacterium]
MKLKIFRMSGLPVQPEALEQYKAEFTSGFDAAKAECGNDMLALQGKLQTLEDALVAKYSVVGEVELPKTGKAWRELLQAYSAPVMVAQSSQNTDEYVLVIVDTQMG